MDIPKLSMAMSQLNVSTAVSTALTKKYWIMDRKMLSRL